MNLNELNWSKSSIGLNELIENSMRDEYENYFRLETGRQETRLWMANPLLQKFWRRAFEFETQISASPSTFLVEAILNFEQDHHSLVSERTLELKTRLENEFADHWRDKVKGLG